MNNPLINPKAGDVVTAIIRGKKKTRLVLPSRINNIRYEVKGHDGVIYYCCIGTWKKWCKKNNAEVMS